MPPSPITGMPWRAAIRAQSKIAVTCGTPVPATTRVVQIEPGPTPTFSASAPASRSARAASPLRRRPPPLEEPAPPLARGDVAGHQLPGPTLADPPHHVDHGARVRMR